MLPTLRRVVVHHSSLVIDNQELTAVELGGWMLGPKLGTAPVVLIMGGITASPFPFGDGANTKPWWPALQAEDLIEPARMTILCPEWPGNGSHFAGVDDPQRTPQLSVQGLADLVVLWLQGIGCTQPLTCVGASLGALVGFALAQRHPDQVSRLVSISAGLRPDGWGTATRHLQREMVRDGLRTGNVETGMIRARQLGMLSYRGRRELDTRFGHFTPQLAVPPVASYLDHHGKRFAAEFPVATFLLLSEAIDRCSFGDTPEQLRAEAELVRAEVTVIGVPGDQLFPWQLQEELHRELQAAGATSQLWKLESEYGHDAFLADQDKLAAILRISGCLQNTAVAPHSRRYQGVGVAPIRRIGIGLIGCGTVGEALLTLIEKQATAIAERYQVRFEVVCLAVRDLNKTRSACAASLPHTSDVLALIANPDVEVIVEAAGGLALEAATRAALAAGKPVVTANKVLLADKLDELAVLAHRTNTPLSCEAAVTAAIPILRHLSHRADEIQSLSAIVNGTCNFLLTRMEQDGVPWQTALQQAQKLGFAELAPMADLSGRDAAAKLSILCYRAFGTWIAPKEMSVRGICELLPVDCALAKAMGFRIRHIARGQRFADGAMDIAVEPLLLPSWHLLASVEEEYNAVYMQCVSSGDLSFFGKGAGGLPTASAMLGDLIDLAQQNTMRWPEPQPPQPATNRPPRRYYLRMKDSAAFPLADLDAVEARYSKNGYTGYLLAQRAESEVTVLLRSIANREADEFLLIAAE